MRKNVVGARKGHERGDRAGLLRDGAWVGRCRGYRVVVVGGCRCGGRSSRGGCLNSICSCIVASGIDGGSLSGSVGDTLRSSLGSRRVRRTVSSSDNVRTDSFKPASLLIVLALAVALALTLALALTIATIAETVVVISAHDGL